MDSNDYFTARYKYLNELFYDNFDKSYFLNKASYLFSLLANLDEYDKLQNREMTFGKIRATGEAFTNESRKLMEQQLKTEICLTYFHAIETLFRLIVTHLKVGYCPWEDLAQLTNFKVFKKEVSKLISGKSFNPNFKTYDEALTYVLFGNIPNTLPDNKWDKNLSNIKDYIYHFGSELLEYKEYNSYKHGLAIFPSKLKSIKFADVITANFDEMILFLEYKTEVDSNGVEIKKVYQTHSALLWEQRFGLLTIVDKLINNIINIGGQRYLHRDGKIKIHLFDNVSLLDVLKADGKTGIQTNKISVSI